jgi:cysteine desulfurase
LLHGGGQERGLRPGTVPVHQVVGMGLAFELAAARREADARQATALRDRLWAGISSLPGVLMNGHPERRVCHILSVSATGLEGESLHFALRDLAVSAGSACATPIAGPAAMEPSAVLRSLGRSDELARSTVRFSVGRTTTVGEIEYAIDIYRREVIRLRRLAPASEVALA